jgi:hypothetical protein
MDELRGWQRNEAMVRFGLMAMAGLLVGCGVAEAACVRAEKAGAGQRVEVERSDATAGATAGDGDAALRWDPLLGRGTILLAVCGHPDWPMQVISVVGDRGPVMARVRGGDAVAGAVTMAQTAVVHAGDTVRLWRQDRELHLEIAAVAEESGAVGRRIKLRPLRSKGSEDGAVTEVLGVVRGAGDVEMEW